MQQHINLLPADENVTIWFGFSHMLMGLFSMMVILSLASAYVLVNHTRTQENMEAQTPSVLGQTTEEYDKTVQDLEEKHQNRQDTLNVIRNTIQTHKTGFSTQFTALARQSVAGLWLKRIEMHAGGRALTLEGITLDWNYIPEWIGKIMTEPIFSGTLFHTFRVAPEKETQEIQFVFKTEN
jgi:hypothetical protein